MTAFTHLAYQARTAQSAIHQALSDNPVVQAQFGDPIRAYDTPPTDAAYPYITYGETRSEDSSADAAPQTTHRLTLHVWSDYSGRDEVLSLMHLIEDVIIHDMPETVLPLYLDVFPSANGLARHGVLRLSVILPTEVAA